ncbi:MULTISPECIES: hypothetical protein [Moorena]|uniref:2-oxoisovalerate dehydrogenase, E1 component beta subunit n=1 Tax=Moorena producens 3L TaxID=489825 RepID=F4XYA3_9CYAN|nr:MULTISPECIES: hypothetical protein [Moorena]EGJ30500.1 hypothetical protein LYNGBM3L_50580 [Moorena producens 3L]OLT68608.1 hypothetical protein BI334_29605 [Moorena producens 3L]
MTIENNDVINMSQVVFLVEEDPDEGYTARALGESIFTQADTLDQLTAMVRDAVQCHFEEANRPNVILLRTRPAWPTASAPYSLLPLPKCLFSIRSTEEPKILKNPKFLILNS